MANNARHGLNSTEQRGIRRRARAIGGCVSRLTLLGVAVVFMSLSHAAAAEERLQPADFHYLGAFRLPDQGERPKTFAWGGNAMTFRPATGGKPAAGELPGSLFIMGHDRIAYGELPDGNQIAEIAIPRPVASRTLSALPKAHFLQRFHDVAAGRFEGLDELPRTGMAYLDAPQTGPRLHLSWGAHFQPDTPVPTHAWVSPDLARADFTGTWFIGAQSGYAVNGYTFTIPKSWADQHVGGRMLATGRYRDGGWSGMGPSLFAYRPWSDQAGTPAPAGTHLQEKTLLRYESSRNTEHIERAMAGYQHPDEWEGGEWITTPSGKSAVVFAGTKSTGDKYWYGFVNPAGPQQPCVAGAFVGQFPVCRLADGRPCPDDDLKECKGHNGFRGWWSTRFAGQFIFYDPADLARVAAGETKPWEPQPYASLTIDDRLFLNPAKIETATLGAGPQRHYRIGAAAYDRDNGHFYVLELFADEDKPVVHVWRIQ